MSRRDEIRNYLMQAQHRFKSTVKPLLFADRSEVRVVRHGPARGSRLYLNRRMHLQLEFGLWESELNSIYRRSIGRADTVYDIGAGDGYTSLLLARIAIRGVVIAFEPDALEHDRLERNLELNPDLRERVKIVPERLGVSEPAGDEETVKLDDLVASGLAPPRFVKIDVDGAELEVLQSAEETLRTFQPTVVVETHSQQLEDGCIRLLTGLGYSTEVVENAWWRTLYPEFRPIAHNRWLLARPAHLLDQPLLVRS